MMVSVAFVTRSFGTSYSTLFPVFRFKSKFNKSSISIHLITDIDNVQKFDKFDHVFLLSRSFVSIDVVHYLTKLDDRKYVLYWLDEADSTGNTSFEVLPYVDYYLKKQFLKRKNQYSKRYYRDRVFTDYYHKHNGVVDTDVYFSNAFLDLRYVNKLKLSWNLLYADYRRMNKIFHYLTRKVNPFYIFNPLTLFQSDNCNNFDVDVFARMSTQYPSNSISYQRKKVVDELSSFRLQGYNIASNGKVPRDIYDCELNNSKTAVSPFGWGEICYRDVEVQMKSCCLIKPDMSHLETWPNIYTDVSYVPFLWDFSNFTSTIINILENDKLRHEISSSGYKIVTKYRSDDGTLFVQHFKSIIGDM